MRLERERFLDNYGIDHARGGLYLIRTLTLSCDALFANTT